MALATHGAGERALPTSWAQDFIDATTTPEAYGTLDRTSDKAEKLRAHQDTENKHNLLLLLSRGYWSTDFLKKVTAAYWEFDHDKGDAAWPGVSLDNAKYAPAPNGSYLTDGVLALDHGDRHHQHGPAPTEWLVGESPVHRVEWCSFAIAAATPTVGFEGPARQDRTA